MSILLGKLAIFVSRLMGNRGTDVGGRIALKFNKRIFKKLAGQIDTIILVTGTNGKSTVTNIIANVFDQLDVKTLNNRKGANMYTGILSAMIESYQFFNKEEIKYAVFEVDEGSIPKVMAEIDNNYIVLTNFFRDQLDRYSEIDLLIDRLKKSLEDKEVELVLNVDDPFCMRFNEFKYVGYGFGDQIDEFEEGSVSDSRHCPICEKPLDYSHNFYGQLGHYGCECGFERTAPKYELTKLSDEEVMINEHEYKHHLMGSYNAYNILAALSLLKELDFEDEIIEKGLDRYYSTDGRMQLFNINNNKIFLNLVKNPAGMNMTLLEVVKLKPKHVSFVLNDYEGDGKDVSWIWDADIEYLLDLDIEKFYVSGTRANDMALRLKNMGVSLDKIKVNSVFDKLLEAIVNKDAVVIVSYTALNDAKKSLLKKEGK